MDLRLFSLAFVTAMSFALAGFAIAPPLPSLTNGDGSVAHNGMKHASISLTDTMLAVHVSDPPPTPVTMMSGYGVDYTPDKFNVLENVYFNAQHGWLPGGILSPPAGGNIWIKRIGVTQPAGSAFRVYEAGNGMEGMGAWTMNEIYSHDGFIWQWDGIMQHDYFAADEVGNYSMTFEVYVGDSAGNPLSEYTPATATFQFTAVPEPPAAILMLFGVLGCLRLRR